MNRDGFWDLIHESLSDWDPELREGNADRQQAVLRELLSALPTSEVVSFENHFAEATNRAYRWDLWAAAYTIFSGCSDDGFMDFRDGLVSLGRAVYDAALDDPESLLAVARSNKVDSLICEGFGAIAYEVLEGRGEEEALEAARSEHPHPRKPAGRRWNPEELPSLLPGLWAAFGEGAAEQSDEPDEAQS